MRILITGASGFLGWNLVRYLKKQPNAEIFCAHGPNFKQITAQNIALDLENPQSIIDIFNWAKPQVIIHTAALAKTNECQQNPEKAYNINTRAVSTLCQQALITKAHLIHCSTDMVFDGFHAPYGERAPTNPPHVYGQTKAEAENIVTEHSRKFSIVRLALMYGNAPADHPCFLAWLDKGLRSESGVTLFTDEYRTALLVDDAARALWALAEKRPAGILHLAGPERLSRAEFGHQYAVAFGLDPRKINAKPLPTPSPDQPRRAPDLSLRIERARRQIDFAPRTLSESLQYLQENSTS